MKKGAPGSPFAASEEESVPDEVVAAGAVVNAVRRLRKLEFPATKADVEAEALEEGADPSVLEQIRALPDRTFEDPADLFAALGDEVERVLD